MNSRKFIFFIWVIVFLSACNDSTSSQKNTDRSSIKAQDILVRSQSSTYFNVDITNFLSHGDDIQLTSVENVFEQSNCEVVSFSNTSIDVYTDDKQSCHYLYTIDDKKTGKSSNARLSIFFSEQSVDQSVRIFSRAAEVNSTVVIDVFDGANLPESMDYQIDKEDIQVLGNGRAELDQTDPSKILYYPDSEEDYTGIQQIYFSYVSSTDQTRIPGLITITLATTINNHAPKVINFRYSDLSQLDKDNPRQLDYLVLDVNQSMTIDVAPYYTKGLLDAFGEPVQLTDSYGQPIIENGLQIHYFLNMQTLATSPDYSINYRLIDQDKDPLSLTDVFVYNASVIRSSSNHTSFTFSASQPGLYQVAYVLADEYGAQGIGIIEIKVADSSAVKPWEPFLYTEKNGIFLSPLSKYEADEKGLSYPAPIVIENGQAGPDGWGTPVLTYQLAYALCETSGMRLPKASELLALKTDYAEGLFRAKDRANPDIIKRGNSVNWPTTNYFWTRQNSAGDARASTVNLGSYLSSSADVRTERRAVACIAPGRIKSVNVVRNNALRLPVGEYNEIEVHIEDFMGKPLTNERVMLNLLHPSLMINRELSSSITDEKGVAKFVIGSKVALENASIRVSFYRDTKVFNRLSFKEAPSYVRQTATQLCLYNKLESMASNRGCANADYIINGRSGWLSDNIFADDRYVYRNYGTNLLIFDDLIKAATYHYSTNPSNRYSYPIPNFHCPNFICNDPIKYPERRATLPIVYDGQYYWVMTRRGEWGKMVAYSSIGDLVAVRNSKQIIDQGVFYLDGFTYFSRENKYARILRRFSGPTGFGDLYLSDKITRTPADGESTIPFIFERSQNNGDDHWNLEKIFYVGMFK